MSATSLPYHESENDGGDFGGAPSSDEYGLRVHLPSTPPRQRAPREQGHVGGDFGGAPSSDEYGLRVHLPSTPPRQQAPREQGNVYFIPTTKQNNRDASHHLTNGGTSRGGPELEARQQTEQHRHDASKGGAQMGRETTRGRIEHFGDTNRNDRERTQRHIQCNPSAPHSLRYASAHMFTYGKSRNRSEPTYEREGKEQRIEGRLDMDESSQGKHERKELRTEERREFTKSKMKPLEQSHLHCSPTSPQRLKNDSVHMFDTENVRNREEPLQVAAVKDQHKKSYHEPKQHIGESMQDDTEWGFLRRGSPTERHTSMNGSVERWETLQVRNKGMEHPRYDKEHSLRGQNEQMEWTDSTKARPERRPYTSTSFSSAAIDYYREFTAGTSVSMDTFLVAAMETRGVAVLDEEDTCFEKWHDRILGVLLGLEGFVNCPVFCLSIALFMASIEAYTKGKKRAYRILNVITWVSIIVGLFMTPILIVLAVAESRKSHVRAGHH